MMLDGTFNGEVIGNNITLMSGAKVSSPAPTAEINTVLLFSTGFLGIATLLRKRKAANLPR